MAGMDAGPTTHRRPPAWAWAWWFAVGGLLGFGAAAMLSIGLPFLLVGAVLGGVGLGRAALRNRSAAAVPAGLALTAAYLAWINRGGPGDVCTTTATSVSCTEEWSPWPFVAVAVLLVGASVALAVGRRAGRARLRPARS
jgi:hypothetical protein